MLVFQHTLPSGNLLRAEARESGMLVFGHPRPSEFAEANAWLEEIVIPALAEMAQNTPTDDFPDP